MLRFFLAFRLLRISQSAIAIHPIGVQMIIITQINSPISLALGIGIQKRAPCRGQVQFWLDSYHPSEIDFAQGNHSYANVASRRTRYRFKLYSFHQSSIARRPFRSRCLWTSIRIKKYHPTGGHNSNPNVINAHSIFSVRFILDFLE